MRMREESDPEATRPKWQRYGTRVTGGRVSGKAREGAKLMWPSPSARASASLTMRVGSRWVDIGDAVDVGAVPEANASHVELENGLSVYRNEEGRRGRRR